MKMRKIHIALPFLFAALLFASCGAETTATSYQCPMKCEGEKTYPTPGNCPVCEMELEGVSPGK